MSVTLSIIIPCYNCEETLREAIDSCYTQELKTDDFELILVDDGSTDATQAVTQTAAQQLENITLISHTVNSGGGAARNTGIKASVGEIIYCLDSDNVFAPQSIKQILHFIKLQNLDGAAFSERRFFHDSTQNYKARKIEKSTEVTLRDLFIEPEPFLDNFFFTRTAYDATDGYPEHHGFDTQAFEFRFLLAGNKIKVCPETIFYHRQGLSEPSYFERVYKSGMYSINYSLIYEDFFHILNEETIASILTYPIFSHPSSIGDSLHDTIKAKVVTGENIFIDNVDAELRPNSRATWLEEHGPSEPTFSLVETVHRLFNQNYVPQHENHRVAPSDAYGTSEYLVFLHTRILLLPSAKSHTTHQAIKLLDQMRIKPIPDSPLKKFVKRHLFLYRIIQKMKHF